MTIFERTKEVATKKGVSLQELAKKSGLGINSIYGWKTKNPSISRLEAVAKVLGVSVDYLLGKEESSKRTDRDLEVEEAIDSARMYQGRPVSDKQREAMKDILKAYLDSIDK